MDENNSLDHKTIIKSYTYLVQRLPDDFTDHLVQEELITYSEKLTIDAIENTAKKNRELISALLRKSEGFLDKLLSILDSISAYRFISDTLRRTRDNLRQQQQYQQQHQQQHQLQHQQQQQYQQQQDSQIQTAKHVSTQTPSLELGDTVEAADRCCYQIWLQHQQHCNCCTTCECTRRGLLDESSRSVKLQSRDLECDESTSDSSRSSNVQQLGAVRNTTNGLEKCPTGEDSTHLTYGVLRNTTCPSVRDSVRSRTCSSWASGARRRTPSPDYETLDPARLPRPQAPNRRMRTRTPSPDYDTLGGVHPPVASNTRLSLQCSSPCGGYRRGVCHYSDDIASTSRGSTCRCTHCMYQCDTSDTESGTEYQYQHQWHVPARVVYSRSTTDTTDSGCSEGSEILGAFCEGKSD